MKKLTQILSVAALSLLSVTAAFAQPINDNCSGAIPVTCGSVVSGNTTTATTDAGLPTCVTTPGGKGIWYTFVGTGTNVTMTTCNATGFDTKILVYTSTGGCSGPFTCVTGNDDASCTFSGLRSTVSWCANLGEIYYVNVGGFGTASGAFVLTTTCGAPCALPANDMCTAAATITCGSAVSGSTTLATFDAAPFCGTSVDVNGSVWYKLTGTGQFVTINTCNSGTNFDTKLHVYTGGCGALTCVTGNDDYSSTPYTCTAPGFSTPNFRSIVEFCANAGQVYLVRVSGFGTSSGNFVLTTTCGPAPTPTITPVGPFCNTDGCVTLSASPSGGTFSGPGVVGNQFCPSVAGPGTHTVTYTLCGSSASINIVVTSAPSNDVCTGALPISCGSSVSGSTLCSTPDPGLTYCGTNAFSSGSAGSNWYTFVGDGQRWTFSTCNAGTNYDTQLTAYEGTCGALVCVAGNDDIAADGGSCSTGPGVAAFKSRINFCTTIGVTYYVLIHGFSTAEGLYQIDVTCTPGPTADAGADACVVAGFPDPSNCTTLTASASGGTPPYTFMWSNGAVTASTVVCPTTTTTYTVTVTDAEGCQDTDDVTVCVVSAVCGNGNNKVSVCHVPPGNPSAAHTICIAPAAVSTHIGGHGGDYLGPCGGCASSSCAGSSKTASAEAAVETSITAYPNPFSTVTTLEFTLSDDDNATLKVFNLQGKEVATLFNGGAIGGQKMSFQFGSSNLAAGIYMAKLTTESGVVKTVKLLIER